MTDLRINRQSTLSGRMAKQVRAIYQASFPPSEQTSFSQIVTDVERRERLAYTAQRAGNVVGFAIANPLPVASIHRPAYLTVVSDRGHPARSSDTVAGIYLLAYLAVVAPMRGRGIGTALLRHMATDLRTQENARGLLIEVEPPETGPADEIALRRRRIQFYSRNGAHTITGVPYRIPNLAGQGSLEMRLMWLPLDGGDRMICRPELRDCIIGIYAVTYGRAEGDPLLASIMRDLS